MEYKPPEHSDVNENVSADHPAKDFLILILASAGVLIILYFFLGFASEWIAKQISFQKEREITEIFYKPEVESGPKEKRLEAIDLLVQELWAPFNQEAKINIPVSVTSSAQPNAFTEPGGRITVTSALLQKADSENEIAFVLCHELGHFYHRHVLARMSQGLSWALIGSALGLGEGQNVLITKGIDLSTLSYARSQENQADEFALRCLQNKYGHINGFDSFFNRIKSQERYVKNIPLAQYSSTHPLSEERIENLDKIALNNNYSQEGDLTPPIEYKSIDYSVFPDLSDVLKEK